MREKIELYREARLWITRVIIPLLGIGVAAMSNEDIRNSVKRLVGKKD